MSEETVTYSELRLQTSSQRRRRMPEVSGTKGIKCFEPIDFSAPSPSWKSIAVVLWIICLVLLLSVGILATKLADIHSGNLTSSRQTDQTEIISGISGIKQPSTNTQVWKCQPCEDNWHQHGKNCYFFSENVSHWRDCQLYCNTLLSSFLKIKTEEEMVKTVYVSYMSLSHQEKYLRPQASFLLNFMSQHRGLHMVCIRLCHLFLRSLRGLLRA
nr:C-type lectin domain family 12 member A-like [Loxodonta africana]